MRTGPTSRGGIHGRRTFLLSTAIVLGGAAAVTGKNIAQGSDHPREPRLFGLSVQGSSPSSIQGGVDAGRALGRDPQVLNFYVAWEWREPFPMATVTAIRDAGAVPEISWEPWHPEHGADQPTYRLDNLGEYDDYVTEFARGCAAYGDALCVRFAHEMNADWYPWSVTANGGSPEAYVAAYRRLHGQFVAAGATNVRWVWCPNVIYRDRPDLIKASYPGDDVVDVVAVDGYNRGGRSPAELFEPTLTLLQDIASSKTVWVNEVGTTTPPDEAHWVEDLFAYLEDTSVEGLVWFELHPEGSPDWRLLSDPTTAAAARTALVRW